MSYVQGESPGSDVTRIARHWHQHVFSFSGLLHAGYHFCPEIQKFVLKCPLDRQLRVEIIIGIA